MSAEPTIPAINWALPIEDLKGRPATIMMHATDQPELWAGCYDVQTQGGEARTVDNRGVAPDGEQIVRNSPTPSEASREAVAELRDLRDIVAEGGSFAKALDYTITLLSAPNDTDNLRATIAILNKQTADWAGELEELRAGKVETDKLREALDDAVPDYIEIYRILKGAGRGIAERAKAIDAALDPVRRGVALLSSNRSGKQ